MGSLITPVVIQLERAPLWGAHDPSPHKAQHAE